MTTVTGNFVVEPHLYERVSDVASELLVAELALNDIVAIQANRKDKAREDSDQDIALDLQAATLSAFIGVLHDYQFASNIDRAIEPDACQLGTWGLGFVEQAERDDYRAAGHELPVQTSSQCVMERGLALPTREASPVRDGHPSDAAEMNIEAISVGTENVHITTPVAPETLPCESSKDSDLVLECVICGDEVVARRSFEAPGCGHRYCRGCIIDLVEASLRDESLYPLRCCHQPLPLASGVFRFISTSHRLQFLAKVREYSVPAGSRVYCSNPRCAAFLDASGDEKRDITCDECDTTSCSQCKNNAHPEEDCSEHRSLLELRKIATANKWQTCPGCHAIVELSQGCYHITCRCSAQFCYLCSAPWRTCDCLQWNEDLLLDDAERRVRNEFGNRAAEARPAAHAERVYQRMEALRENHECQDHFWVYRHGCGRCEECGDFLRIFLMRCANCQSLVCRRCSVNRL